MKTGNGILLAALVGILSTLVGAAPRTSSNYRIPAEAIDRGGRVTSSTNYRNIGSAGLIVGRASGAGGTVINSGYVAQLDLGAIQVLSAVSRKVHGASGTFDIALPLTGLAGIECRNPGAGGSHQVVVTFSTAVTVGSVSVTSSDGMAGGTRSVSGTTVTVDLTAVANAQTLGITLVNVSNGSSTGNISIPVGILLGDTTGNGSVTASDIGQVKSQAGLPVTASNFRTDVTVNGGTINSTDIGLVKSRAGTSLP